jgi:hypothetical protein
LLAIPTLAGSAAYAFAELSIGVKASIFRSKAPAILYRADRFHSIRDRHGFSEH